MGNIYVQIMECCRPFYSLPSFNAETSALFLSPRLDDALAMSKGGDQQNDAFQPVRHASFDSGNELLVNQQSHEFPPSIVIVYSTTTQEREQNAQKEENQTSICQDKSSLP